MPDVNAAVGNLLAGLATVAVRRPIAVVVLLLILSALSLLVSWRFGAIDSDLGKLIRPSDELAWVRHDDAFKAAFPQTLQTAVLVVSGPDADDVDVTGLRLVAALRASGELGEVFAPTLDPFLRDHRLYFLDHGDLERWIDGVDYDQGVLMRLADGLGLADVGFAFADHLSVRARQPLPSPLTSFARAFADGVPASIDLHAYPHLVDPEVSTHYAIIVVKGHQRLDERLPNAHTVALLRRIASATPIAGDARVRLTGEIVLADEEIGAALSGITLAGSVSLVLLALILGFGVRSIRLIAAVFALLLIGVACTLGWATLAVGSYNTLALIFVVMFFGLGVDFAVHFGLRVQEGMAGGADVEHAAAIAARDIGPALLLCMLTSSIAFLAFTPTAYRGMAELGLISAGGMVIAAALAFIVIPVFLRLGAPVPGAPAAGSPSTSTGQAVPDGESAGRVTATPIPATARYPRLVIATVLLLGLAALPAALQLRFDYSVLAMRDAETEAMSTLLELQQQHITTDYSISVLATDLADARALAARIEQLDAVGAVLTPLDLLPRDQARKAALLAPLTPRLAEIGAISPSVTDEFFAAAVEALHGARASVRDADLPDFDAMLAGLDALVDRPAKRADIDAAMRASLEADLMQLRRLVSAEPFDIEDLPADLRRRFFSADGRVLLSVQPAEPLADREATGRFIEAVAAVAPNHAGRSVIEWGVGAVVVDAFMQAAALALVSITALLVLFFRGVLLPLLVLTPLLLATLFTFALAQLAGVSLNMANILVVPLIFGLGVDTGIHVVHRFSHAGGVAGLQASSTPRAVLISGLTTIGTFFSLCFSPHVGAASVGLLLLIAISLMLIATFIVLPALLEWLVALRDAAPRA